MLRFAAAVLALVSVVAPAQAESFDDGEGRFSVTVPDGWQAGAPKTVGGDLALVMAGAEGKDYRGICIVMVGATPETKSMTQAEIDDAMTAQLTDDFWKAGMKAGAGSGVTMDVESSGSRDASSRRVHYAVIVMDVAGKDGAQQKMKGKFEMHPIPGSMHGVICMTMAASYEAASVDFEAIFTSYTPKRGLVAEAPQGGGRSVLTLYASRDFEGAAQVLSQDAPNLAAMGLSTAPASVSVAGFGQWEVCAGMNFTGGCRLVAAAETAAGGQSLAFASARRAKPQGARDAAGVANALAARALTEVRLRTR